MNKSGNILRIMLAAAALAAVIAQAPADVITWTNTVSGYWTNGGSWSGGIVPGPADDVVFSTGSATVTIDEDVTINSLNVTGTYAGTLTFETGTAADLTINNDLYLKSGATIATPYSSLVGQGAGRIITVGGNATIAGTINGDQLGWPGGNTNAPGYGGPAAHGGKSSAAAASTYGSVTAPLAPGSGAPPYGGVSRAGGGALKLDVAGTLQVTGSIRMTGGSYGTSCGSGGSVWIIADTFEGSGSITANGGSAAQGWAGGGRISIEYATSTFSGTVSLTGYQPGTLWEPGRFQAVKGAPGSPENIKIRSSYHYFFPDQTTNYWNLNLSNCFVFFQNGAFNITNIALFNVAQLRFDVATNGTTAKDGINDIMMSGGIFLRDSLLAAADGDFQLSDVTLTNITTNGAFLHLPPRTHELDSLYIGTGSVFYTSHPRGDTNAINPDSGGTPSIPHGEGTEIIVKNDVIIDGTLNLDEAGFTPYSGPGAGIAYGSQAAYGGKGTIGTANPYGNLLRPSALGSGSASWGGVTKSGGGALKLDVRGTLSVKGTITANGGAYGSSGSGGSIWIKADSLAGSGAIRANGGTRSTPGEASGGGRVALEYGLSAFAGTVRVLGYVANTFGTVLRCSGMQRDDTVALDSKFGYRNGNIGTNGLLITREIIVWKTKQPKLEWTDLSTDLSQIPLANVATNTLSGLPLNARIRVFRNDEELFIINSGTNGTITFAVELDGLTAVRVAGPSGGTAFSFW